MMLVPLALFNANAKTIRKREDEGGRATFGLYICSHPFVEPCRRAHTLLTCLYPPAPSLACNVSIYTTTTVSPPPRSRLVRCNAPRFNRRFYAATLYLPAWFVAVPRATYTIPPPRAYNGGWFVAATHRAAQNVRGRFEHARRGTGQRARARAAYYRASQKAPFLLAALPVLRAFCGCRANITCRETD